MTPPTSTVRIRLEAHAERCHARRRTPFRATRRTTWRVERDARLSLTSQAVVQEEPLILGLLVNGWTVTSADYEGSGAAVRQRDSVRP